MLELIFSPLGPGSPRTESGVVSLIGVEDPWPKIPTPLVPPVLLPLPTPLAPSLRGCSHRPSGPPRTAEAGLIDQLFKIKQFFQSDLDIIAVKKYKRTGEFPVSADTDRKRNAFKAKYQFFDISKDGQNLMYTPTNLQVVSKISRKMILTKEYKNSFGSGSRNFYKTIREK
jgi:hypothetical protein